MLKRLSLLLALAIPFAAFAQAPATPAKPAAKTAKPPADVKKEPAPATDKAGSQRVVLHTSQGDITIELFADKAPKTVENFLQYVKDGYYDGTTFHRVIDNFMIQGGGFTKDMREKKGLRPTIRNEANNGLSNTKGTVAMARTGDPHSAAAQFFINVVDNKRLDYVSDQNPMTWGYAVFGKVVAGQDVVDKIRAIPTGPAGPFKSDVPTTPVVIEKAETVAQ